MEIQDHGELMGEYEREGESMAREMGMGVSNGVVVDDVDVMVMMGEGE